MRLSPGCFLPATRKKLFELARAFSEKTKMRKSKRKHLLKHQVYPKRGLAAICPQQLGTAAGLQGAGWASRGPRGLCEAVVWRGASPAASRSWAGGCEGSLVVLRPRPGPLTCFP